MTRAIVIDGRRYTPAEFAAATGLSVGGSLDLRGTGITALPEGISVGGSLDLSGTGITNVYRAGSDRRGYEFIGARLRNGWRVLAGCRNFSPADALAHWAHNPECLALAQRVIEAGERGGMSDEV